MGTWTHVTNRLYRQKNDSMFLSQYQFSVNIFNETSEKDSLGCLI